MCSCIALTYARATLIPPWSGRHTLPRVSAGPWVQPYARVPAGLSMAHVCLPPLTHPTTAALHGAGSKGPLLSIKTSTAGTQRGRRLCGGCALPRASAVPWVQLRVRTPKKDAHARLPPHTRPPACHTCLPQVPERRCLQPGHRPMEHGAACGHDQSVRDCVTASVSVMLGRVQPCLHDTPAPPARVHDLLLDARPRPFSAQPPKPRGTRVVWHMCRFQRASSFNQNLDGWAVGSVETLPYAFYQATAFDQDLSSVTLWRAATVAGATRRAACASVVPRERVRPALC